MNKLETRIKLKEEQLDSVKMMREIREENQSRRVSREAVYVTIREGQG
jgi:hypothetical protein